MSCSKYWIANFNHGTMRPYSTFNIENLMEENEDPAEEWMGRLWIKVAECDYKYNDRQSKQ